MAVDKHGQVEKSFTTVSVRAWATVTEGVLKFNIKPNKEIVDSI